MTHRRERPAVVVDTGPLVALINADDGHHERCVAWLTKALGEQRKLIIPVPVITEVCHLLSKTAGSDYEANFLDELSRTPSNDRDPIYAVP